MDSSQVENPQEACEQILIDGKRYNIEHKILPSENAVAERLLARRTELKDAYEEIHGKLHANPAALKTYMQLVLYTAAFWNPEQAIQARNDRGELTQVNKQISHKASELAALLKKRSELHNTSGFTSDSMHHDLPANTNEVPAGLAHAIAQLTPKARQEALWPLILELCALHPHTAEELARLLHRQTTPLKTTHLKPTRDQGLIDYLYSEVVNHPDQAHVITEAGRQWAKRQEGKEGKACGHLLGMTALYAQAASLAAGEVAR